jgi:uncharacterized low-complexity protein
MSRKTKTSTLTLGAAVAFGLAAMPAFSSTPANPFEAQPLNRPYLAKAESKPESKPTETKKSTESKPKASADKKAKDMKCGEGTCAGKK